MADYFPQIKDYQRLQNLQMLLGGLGRVVNSLDLCLALLKSPGCFYFLCILSSQWKAVTVNLQILHFKL